ncbi:tyrosine-type recombinase/integrase [Robinsoniella sp. KNHs210]|uniref:tyrosine-type recombinase/integrase n=1 Tax=Robinsoniella sp. KNHs210 TaxID=1469950 RepID=UPI0004879275|nr:site-specific integrase [Robinsoniella sp. KNHs210]
MIKAKKRSDGRYAKQITIGYKEGKPHRKTIYAATLKELDKKYREFMDLKESGKLIENEKMIFRKLSELWLVNTKKGEVKDQSYNNISSQIKGLNHYLGDLYVYDIKRSHIEQIRSDLISKNQIDKYNKALSNARAIFDYAISLNLISKNPTFGMKRITKKSNKRALTIEERHLIESTELDEFEKCFTTLLLYTGMRRSEALALNVSDIDFDKMRITVNKTLVLSKASTSSEILQDNTKTDAGTRFLPITHDLLPVIKEYCRNRVGILFLSEYGNYIGTSTFRKRWLKLLSKLKSKNGGVLADDITPHIFRHTYASDLYKAGIDIKTAQYLLGHKDIKTTLDTYTHFGYVDVKIDKLEQYYKSDAVKMQSDKKIIPINA